MSWQEEFNQLRFKHKSILAESALRIYRQSGDQELIKNEVVKRLLNGKDLNDILNILKNLNGNLPLTTENFSLKGTGLGQVKIINNLPILLASREAEIEICIENRSDHFFVTSPEIPIFASYHWYTDQGEVYEHDGLRTSLKKSITPGEDLRQIIKIKSPAEPGNYYLEVSVVHEGKYWYEQIGLNTSKIYCAVQDYGQRGFTRQAFAIFQQLI